MTDETPWPPDGPAEGPGAPTERDVHAADGHAVNGRAADGDHVVDERAVDDHDAAAGAFRRLHGRLGVADMPDTSRDSGRSDGRFDDRFAAGEGGGERAGEGPGEGPVVPLDEEALRRLLHDVVEGIDPRPEALAKLRRAVPARRARRRQALVGAAAAVILAGTAVPALVHVARSADVAGDRPANAGHGQRDPGGMDGVMDSAPGHDHSHRRPGTEPGDGPRSDRSGTKPGEPQEPRGTAPAGSADPTGTMAVSSPLCSRDQLGRGTAYTAPADRDGKVYGAFRVVNTSRSDCTVDGGGGVMATAKGGAESSRIQVVDHTTGDAATGLPAPTLDEERLILKPGQAYEVKFAWVPADGRAGGCAAPTASPEPGGTPSQGATPPAEGTDTKSAKAESSGAGAAGNPDGETAGGGGTAGGGTGGTTLKPEASVVLSHTPEVGEPAAADTTIPNACAGTIYRTGALPTTP
ncbi:hypothetical protein [Streptomyces sp. URMC 123]|uniref:hypothetical protein n=1 Tax=Streptomyces sp. URMC 123 TaxID=3423403 RepID=UPI003F19B102